MTDTDTEQEASDSTEQKRPKGAALLAVLVFVLVLVVGAIGFTVSWDNLFEIAKSGFPGEVEIGTWSVEWAHSIPAVVDGGIIALTLMRLWNAVNGRRLPIASWFLNGLIAVTIAVNATAGDDALGVLLHALPAAVYVAVSEMFIHSILKRYKTIEEDEPKKKTRGVSLARWVLAPISTFVMWRVMTICGTDDLAVFVKLARVRVAQHQAWRKGSSLWWVPILGVSRADRTELRMRLLELSVNVNQSNVDNTPPPVSEQLTDTGERSTVSMVSTDLVSASEHPSEHLPVSGERGSERPTVSGERESERPAVSAVSAHPTDSVSASEHLPVSGERVGEHRPVSIPAIRERNSERSTVSAPVASTDATKNVDGVDVAALEVAGVPDPIAAGWIALQLQAGKEKFSPKVAELFNVGASTARRWVNCVDAHLDNQPKQSENASV